MPCKMPQAGFLNENSTVSQLWGLEIQDQSGNFNFRRGFFFFPGLYTWQTLLYSYMGESKGQGTASSCYKDTSPATTRKVVTTLSPEITKSNYFSKAQAPNNISLGIRASAYEFQGMLHIAFHICCLKSMLFSHAKYVYSLLVATKTATHSSINSEILSLS